MNHSIVNIPPTNPTKTPVTISICSILIASFLWLPATPFLVYSLTEKGGRNLMEYCLFPMDNLKKGDKFIETL